MAQHNDSVEFAKFAEDWDFSHTTASPHHPQANGLAERTVKTVKQIFKKCKDSKQDPLFALLNCRDTPLECGYSPSQLLMHRGLRTMLPDANIPMSVSPKREEVVKQKMSEKCRQKHYYDQKTQASDLPTLTRGDTVCVRTAEQANWAENIYSSENRFSRLTGKLILILTTLRGHHILKQSIYQSIRQFMSKLCVYQDRNEL